MKKHQYLVTERAPEASVPVVERFSSPKVMAPLLSVMLPLASVRLPADEAVAALIAPVKLPVPVTERAPEASVPAVERFSSPNATAPLELVILPSRVRFPTVDPVAAAIVPVVVTLPALVTFINTVSSRSASIPFLYPRLNESSLPLIPCSI